MDEQVKFPRGAKGLLFDTLISQQLTQAQAHVIMRAMCHLGGSTKNTFPSTKEGQIMPFGAQV